VGSFRRSLGLLHAAGGDRFEEAGIASRLGDSLLASGQPADAAEAWQQALGLYIELDDPEAASVRLRLAQLGT
jgi:predicted negative regulator of RcsB-dependent stress response